MSNEVTATIPSHTTDTHTAFGDAGTTVTTVTTGPPGPPGLVTVSTPGFEVLVPADFAAWGEFERSGFLARRRADAAEAEVVAFAHRCVERARASAAGGDAWELAVSMLGEALAMSRHGASRLVATASRLFCHLPRVASLLTAGWIGVASAHAIVEETEMVDEATLPVLDREIAARLEPTRRRTHAPLLGPLRKMVAGVVRRFDPVGAAARARQARERLDVRLHPLPDDLAEISATLPAHWAVEIMGRVEALAATAGPEDSRSIGRRCAAALLAVTRGWSVLPDASGEASAAPGAPAAEAACRVVLHAYETDNPAQPTWLGGYGAVTELTRQELAEGARRTVHRVADLASAERDGALRYRPSEALRRFCQGRDGECVFPGCSTRAERCDLDHIVPFDHDDPAAGGRTTSDGLACLCRFHHRLKTDGVWAYHRAADGGYVWTSGPRHPSGAGRRGATVEPVGPLAGIGKPWSEVSSAEQRRWVERAVASAAPELSAASRGRRPTAQRKDDERRRARAGVPVRAQATGAGGDPVPRF